MQKNTQQLPVRKEQKIAFLSLFFPVEKKMGKIARYKFDAAGMHLVRVIHCCKVAG
jgi:hypothetical protein